MLTKKHRIPKDKIMEVMRKGRKYWSNGFFDIRYTSAPEFKFTFIVSTKISKRAVDRNKIKRKFRAAVGNLIKQDKLNSGNYVFITRSIELLKYKSQEYEEMISKAMSS
jgi:ribonuclease P protein component